MDFFATYVDVLGRFLLAVGTALVPFLLFLLLYKLVVQLRYRLSSVSLDQGLGAADNSAVNVLMVGLFLGLVFALRGLHPAQGAPLVDRLTELGAFGALAIVLQLAAQVLANKVILYRFDDVQAVFSSNNTAAACVKAAIAVATGLMLATAGWGGFEQLGQALVWFVVGQAILVFIGLFYQWITPYDIQHELEQGNLAVGFGFAGMIISGGLVVSRAVAGGETVSWGTDLLSVGTFVATILAVALLSRRVFDWLVLPHVSMNREIAENRNLGVGLVEAAAYVLPALFLMSVI